MLKNIEHVLQEYSMHIFGIIAFMLTFTMGTIALIKQSDSLAMWLPIGIFIFTINLFYIKLIHISRQDYEISLEKEKDYSQSLLKRQKLFLRNVIHETNTPLAIIMANTELFEHEYGNHPALSNIEAAAKSIYGIYDDLSYLTKKDSVVYHQQEIDLVAFIQTRIAFFEIVAHQSNLKIIFKTTFTTLNLLINETKLQRIIDNNITNAIKYTKEDSVISIILEEYHDNIILEFSSPSTIIKKPKQVFDAYYRENYNKEGFGLGLNLVKHICKEENVTIDLVSTEEKTSFRYLFKKERFENIIARR